MIDFCFNSIASISNFTLIYAIYFIYHTFIWCHLLEFNKFFYTKQLQSLKYPIILKYIYLRLFESVVAVAFQSAFHSTKHVNNVFLFLKNYF